jgi:hypothetical protein
MPAARERASPPREKAIMKKPVLTFGAVLLASSAWAGASIKTNMVPVVDVCSAGNCAVNAQVCVTNADCNLGSVSAKSKVSLGANGRLKILLKDVVDGAGMDGSGGYMVPFNLVSEFSSAAGTVLVTVDGGKGKADVDISTLMGSTGDAVLMLAALANPPTVPADCPGTGNTPAEIEARYADTDCFSGGGIGYAGVGSGGKSSFKAFVPPVVDICDGGGCDVNGGVCATNADCAFGALSAKSKLSLTGAGRLKVQLKKVVDAAGMDASGDYMVSFALLNLPSASLQFAGVKITVAGGKGKADLDLSSIVAPAGDVVFLHTTNGLYTPPLVPADCPGTGNTAAEVLARGSDIDCFTGDKIGAIGVAVE